MKQNNIKEEIEKILVFAIDLQSEKNPNNIALIEQLKGLLTTLIDKVEKDTAKDVLSYFRYLPKESWQPVGGISNIKYVPSHNVDWKIKEVEEKYNIQ